jgi:predicted esterase
MERVICLHGYGQTDDIFKHKCSSIRKHLAKKYELVFIRGPHVVTHVNGEPGNAWWPFVGDFGHITTDKCEGIEQSINLIRTYEPFVGVIGFSQGGALASILPAIFPLKFCITIGAFSITDPN